MIITLIVMCCIVVLLAVAFFGYLCYEYGFSKAVWMLIDVKNNEGWTWAHFLRAERKHKDTDKDKDHE